MKKIRFILLCAIVFVARPFAYAQQPYYFPESGNFDPKIPTPEAFLGYPIGSHYTRHDQIIAYFKELARLSDRVHVELIGKTYEERPQLIATITSPGNYANLEQIRQEHLKLVDPEASDVDDAAPVVVLLGYSVHGNETSSGEASLLTAYYLAANQNPETATWLNEAIVFIDPSLNPDGRDRAANWLNGNKSFPPVADPADREHNEIWPAGRTNHFLTDLNRDWLSATQVESRNRLDFFHKWYPNVHIDFHEMGTSSTYYFEPTPAGHESPLLPRASYEFNARLAKHHVAALDKIGSLYFTKESYDNLSPIYGSTYPDFFGGVGVTFEQGSSRGLVQESPNGLVTFPFTIRNQLTSGLATVRGAVAEKAGLFELQKGFFKSAVEQGKANPSKAFVFGDRHDPGLTHKLLDLLLRHHLEVYEIADDLSIENKQFEKGTAYIVPAAQPNFRIVHSIFEETPKLADSAFYDNTAWSIIHAYGLQYAKLKSFTAGDAVSAVHELTGSHPASASGYAYLLNWADYNASKALYYLLDHGIRVKAAHKPFTARTPNGDIEFGYGSLVIPVASQSIDRDSLHAVIGEAARAAKVRFTSTESGFNVAGIDLGSSNIRTVEKPEVALLTGIGTTAGEVGEVWFLLNKQLNIPVTKLDISNFSRTSLNRYNNLVLVSGNYDNFSKNDVEKIKSWVSEGGTLITFKTAAEWAIKAGLSQEKLYQDTLKPKENNQRIDYVNRSQTETAQRINGGIFLADLDITNPIAFGIRRRAVYFTKNGTTILNPSKNKYATIAKYHSNAYISGYVAKDNVNKISNSAAILASSLGSGNILLFAENPNYRHYWHGTDRLFINALFFGNQLSYGGRF